jgi:hypothetical protein
LNLVNTQAPVTDDPVAAQLANMAAALNSLAVMHNTTSSEMAEMRAELASIRALAVLTSGVMLISMRKQNNWSRITPLVSQVLTFYLLLLSGA